MSSRILSSLAGLCLAGLICGAVAQAQPLVQTPAAAVVGVVDLQATAQVEVTPDLAVMTLSIERSGMESARLTADISQSLQAALKQARAVSGVEASSGAISTQPRWPGNLCDQTRLSLIVPRVPKTSTGSMYGITQP